MGFNTFPCNPYPISTDELNKGNNDDLNARVDALESDVSDLEEQKANQITIALPFNQETTYEVGDIVYYNGLSYRCTNEHTGEWDADDFAGTTIANELSELKSGLTSVETSETFNTLHAKKFGKLAIISGFFMGDGTASISLGLCSGYYGVLGVRNANSGALSNYYFSNGSISGWDGSDNRQFTADVQYIVSGVLVEST